jgi:hypothetical protein
MTAVPGAADRDVAQDDLASGIGLVLATRCALVDGSRGGCSWSQKHVVFHRAWRRHNPAAAALHVKPGDAQIRPDTGHLDHHSAD